jgi:chromosome partitioning protein
MAEFKRIALVNRKGGVGKTTSAGYLAMALHNMGQQVTGVDTDSERGWLKWHKACSLPYPVIGSDAETLREDVEALQGFVVIDTPPNSGEIIYKAASLLQRGLT